MAEAGAERVIVGRISGLYGVQGWVRVYSHTDPRDNILRYSPWLVRVGGEWRALAVLGGRRHGKGIVARLADCQDRDQARRLLGAEVAIGRAQLPELESGEYYWTDLLGLRVVNKDGIELGRVDHLLETGGNDVLVLAGERERLIPFLPEDVVLGVDLETGVIRVDWDPDF